MVRLNKRLDPSQTGSEAEKLFGDLSKRLVGQDEAIDAIGVDQVFVGFRPGAGWLREGE